MAPISRSFWIVCLGRQNLVSRSLKLHEKIGTVCMYDIRIIDEHSREAPILFVVACSHEEADTNIKGSIGYKNIYV